MDHTQVQVMPKTSHNGRVIIDPAATMTEREACYYAALKLVTRIDDDLARQTGHYRNKAGKLLKTLDQVVNAILTDDLMTAPAVLEAAA